MEALLERVETDRVTEPRLPAVSGGQKCGVEGCNLAASPWVRCAAKGCGIALCDQHAAMDYSDESHENKAYCPKHKKGGG